MKTEKNGFKSPRVLDKIILANIWMVYTLIICFAVMPVIVPLLGKGEKRKGKKGQSYFP